MNDLRRHHQIRKKEKNLTLKIRMQNYNGTLVFYSWSGQTKGLKNLAFTAFLLEVQQLKGQCKASTVIGRQVGRWQLDS